MKHIHQCRTHLLIQVVVSHWWRGDKKNNPTTKEMDWSTNLLRKWNELSYQPIKLIEEGEKGPYLAPHNYVQNLYHYILNVVEPRPKFDPFN